MMLTCTWTDVQNLSTNATIIALTPDSTPVVRNNIAHHHPGTRYIINFCTSRSLTRNVTERNEKFLLYSTNVEFCRLKILTSPRYSEIRNLFHNLLEIRFHLITLSKTNYTHVKTYRYPVYALHGI